MKNKEIAVKRDSEGDEIVMSYTDAFCRCDETKEINIKLKDLYTVWHRGLSMNSQTVITDPSGKTLNPLHLLTCTDSYLDSKEKVMMFGQEAHDTKNEKTVFLPPEDYFQSDYAYSEMIHEGKAPMTLFLKQRFLVAGLSEPCFGRQLDSKETFRFEGVLLNNLNKTSFSGDHMPVENNGLLKSIYEPFEFNGFARTIFEHELMILRPRKLIFLVGKSYFPHIKRDFESLFSGEVLDKIQKEFKNLSMKNRPVSGLIEFIYSDNAEQKAEIIVGYHPNARMKTRVRDQYNQVLVSFAGSGRS